MKGKTTAVNPATAQDYARLVEDALEPLRNQPRAVQMRAYMRGQYAFLGIPTTERRAAVAGIKPGALDQQQLLLAADLLWDRPEREYQYVATDLLRKQARKLDASAIDHLLRLARQHAWWDTVDSLAGVVGEILLEARKAKPDAQRKMDRALQDKSMWVRRIAMLHQLGWRMQTDTERLSAYALQLAPETDFFIRKAIGWALRDYARWNERWVRDFILSHRQQLSPLTVREGGKHLLPGRVSAADTHAEESGSGQLD